MKIVRFIAAWMLALASTMGMAQDHWPSKPIHVVVPLPPGISGDYFARSYAQALQQSLGVPVTVDNKPGASGIIGTDFVAKAPPDGYTLLWGFPSLFAMNPFLYSKLPYSPKDFVPIAHTYSGAFVLVANPNLPAKNLQELIDYAKANPGKINYGSYGAGGQPHLGMEVIQDAAKIKLVHVPYKSGVLTDVVGGQVQLLLEPSSSALPFIKAGKLRALAVTSSKRLDILPDVPTLSETLPGVEIVGHAGMWAPAKVPPEIVKRLSDEVVRITKTPEMTARIREGGFIPTGLPSAELAEIVRKETQLWGGVIKAKNIHLD